MDTQAKWIFCDSSQDKEVDLSKQDIVQTSVASLINVRALARKVFSINEMPVDANFLITADSRYRLFINGQWVNDGPVRCFPWKYSYDRIDVASYLRKGKNVICVILEYYGEDTFQYIVTHPGLLGDLEIRTSKTSKHIVTDNSWKMTIDSSYNKRVGRISCQMAYEEQIDARKAVDWLDMEFDDSKWEKAQVISEANAGPWKNLTERDIPLLARECVLPLRIKSKRFVKLPRLIEGFNLKRQIWPDRTDANYREFHCIVITNIKSSAAQQAKFYQPTCSVMNAEYYLNGKKIKFPDKCIYKTVALNRGDNFLIIIANGISHFDDVQLILDSPRQISIINPFGKGKWAVAGNFKEDEKYINYTSLEKLKRSGIINKFKPVSERNIITADVHAGVVRQEKLDGEPKIINSANMLNDNDETTVISPSKKDIEIMLDFDKEYNMYIELELYAPEGVIIDAHCFEAFKYDGTPQYTRHNRSGFRYVTKKGWQKFLSMRHFGARYLILTFRNVSDATKIKRIKGHFIHHHLEHIGQFNSSDYMLNKIWEIGKQTMLCCMEDTFVDCPTYEQTYWVGDGRNEALIAYYLFGAYDIAARCVKLPALSLRNSPLVISQVPSGWSRILTAWSLLWVQMVWEYYFHSADEKTLKRVYPSVRKMLDNCIEQFTDPQTNLLSIDAWNMFDWTAIDEQNSKIVTHNNAFLVQAYRCAANMAKALNLSAEKNKWLRRADITIKAINRHLWDNKQSAYIDSIHSDGTKSKSVSRPVNTLMLLYDIAPAKRAKLIEPIVLGKRTKDIVPFGSPFAIFYLLEYLVKCGKYAELLKFIRDNWSPMLEFGATTCWETFCDSNCSPEGAPTRSHCHGWSAGPNYFLGRVILGVCPLDVGFKKVLIAPQCLDLEYASGVVPTPYGNIAVEWKKINDGLDIKINAPAEIKIVSKK